jgi:hypothetical protein
VNVACDQLVLLVFAKVQVCLVEEEGEHCREARGSWGRKISRSEVTLGCCKGVREVQRRVICTARIAEAALN